MFYQVQNTLKVIELGLLRKSLVIRASRIGVNIRKMTKGCSSVLDPWFITGFSDAESCFSIFITKSKSYALGWTVSLSFEIGLHVRDIATLKAIQDFFGGIGHISISGSTAKYRVRSRSELQVIIDHFTNYPLCTSHASR